MKSKVAYSDPSLLFIFNKRECMDISSLDSAVSILVSKYKVLKGYFGCSWMQSINININECIDITISTRTNVSILQKNEMSCELWN